MLHHVPRALLFAAMSFAPTISQRSLLAEQAVTLSGHTGTVRSLAFTPDGLGLISSGDDGRVILWNVAERVKTREFPGNVKAVYSVAVSPDGKLLTAGGADKVVRIWNLETGAAAEPLGRHDDSIWSVAFAPQGRRIVASGGDDKLVKLWDPETRVEVGRYSPGGAVSTVAFAPDGRTFAASSNSGTGRAMKAGITRWERATAKELSRFAAGGQEVVALAFSPDGKRLAAGGVEQLVQIWSNEPGKLETVLTAHTGTIYSLAYSRDGRVLASSGDDGWVRVWQTSNWKIRDASRNLGSPAHAVAISPSGITLAASAGESVKLWSLAANEKADVPTPP